ncbi:MAG: hypothetical protein HC880_06680 [Bacteroidia bacterium]|nr:hypothetical protein [Bacteroidia bacterium]
MIETFFQFFLAFLTLSRAYEPGFITELELQMLLSNKSWYDNVVFHEGGKILGSQEIASKGIKYLGQ